MSRVQQEIRQARPFRSASQEALLAMLRTTDALKRRAAARIGLADITLQQYNVLRILCGAGPEGLPTLEIADRMVEQAPGVTRLLDRLEAKRLVRRERCPDDRRQVTCRISPAGLEILKRLDPVVDEVDAFLGTVLAAAELRQLIGMLDRVRAASSHG